MKICHFDPFSGISGDMTVGALVDAGADAGELGAALESLGTGAAFRFERVQRRGVAAAKFRVEARDEKKHRHLPQILEMLERGALPPRAKANAQAVFRKLGEAEAAVHGVPVEKGHFHEVGAVDSICDIAGACAALALLGVDEVRSAPVNVGSGTVQTEHGVLPVPAPATARLLEGKPVYARGPARELTTPTGAALLATLAAGFGPPPPLRIDRTGYGAGDFDFPEHANVLRVLLGTALAAAEAGSVTVIEANIDDASPQVLGYAMERLLAAGALDVSLENTVMKKNRAGVLLRVIAKPEDRDRLAEVVFAETPTLGLRLYDAERRVRAREFLTVETPYGLVRIKVAQDGSFAPEYEDCRALALQHAVPLKRVLAEASYAYLKTIR
jgi:uncharacterized protein (TIGR00299 family) protein